MTACLQFCDLEILIVAVGNNYAQASVDENITVDLFIGERLIKHTRKVCLSPSHVVSAIFLTLAHHVACLTHFPNLR